MDAYDQRRRADILPRQAVIHSMNSSLLSGIAGLHTLRAAGIALIDRFTPLRQRVMREGLAPSRYLPRAMRA
jgi:2-octaprenyl-6-methoxyphenol hydroxylase